MPSLKTYPAGQTSHYPCRASPLHPSSSIVFSGGYRADAGHSHHPVGRGQTAIGISCSAHALIFFCGMGHVDKEIRFNERAASTSPLSRSPAWNAILLPAFRASFTCRSTPATSTSTAHPRPSAIISPPSRPKMTGWNLMPAVASLRALTPFIPPSRKSAHPNIPDRIMPVTDARIPATSSSFDAVARSRCLRPSGGVTRLSRSPVLPQSVAMVSARCVWALKRAGQIQTGVSGFFPRLP